MMAFHQAVKNNPLVLAGREIVFAGVSVIASTTMTLFGYQHIIKNHILDPERRNDVPTLMKIATGMEKIATGLSIAAYAGLSKLTLQQPGAKLYPTILSSLQRPPLPIPQTIAVASMAFVLGPIASVSSCLVSAPLIELYHNVAEDISGPSKMGRDEIVPTSIKEDHTSSSDHGAAAASVEQQVPPLIGDKKPLQMSYGTKLGPLMEAAVPGSVTVIGPLAEEIFFRGQLFGRLVPHLGCIPAALTSSALFGFAHRAAPPEGKRYFSITEAMLGLVSSLLYFRTGRLLVPFAFHSGCNVWFVVGSALTSCPTTLADKYMCAKDPVACPVNPPPELSFWERRVAKNWSFINSCLIELSSMFNGKTASAEDAPFLPLDFWGTAEMASKESIFYDHQHDRLLKAPSLCNADGTPSNFANFLMDVLVDQLFGSEDSISIDRLIQYSTGEKRLQFPLHILATRPAHAESSGLLELIMKSSPDELASLKTQDWVGQGHQEYLLHDCWCEAGLVLLDFPTEMVKRSEYMEVTKKNFANCLRMGMYAELNRYLFIVYCLVEGRGSIPELLKSYYDLAAAIQKQPPEWYKEWAEK